MADTNTHKWYLDCSELPIWNFHMAGSKNDYRYLLKVNDINDIDTCPIEIGEVWEAIYNEYCLVSDNREAQAQLQTIAQVATLKQEIFICSTLAFHLMQGLDKKTEQKYFSELAGWGFAFNQKNFVKELKRLDVWLKSKKTRINMLESEMRTNQKKTTHPVRLEKQQVKLERLSGRNEIDVKKCSLTKWLEIIKDTEEMVREKGRKHKKVA